MSTYLTVQNTFVSQTLTPSHRNISSHDSYRHSNPIPDTRVSVLLAPSHLCYPPSVLKLGGLESPGQRLISWNGKTKRIALFFFGKHGFFFRIGIFGDLRNFIFFFLNIFVEIHLFKRIFVFFFLIFICFGFKKKKKFYFKSYIHVLAISKFLVFFWFFFGFFRSFMNIEFFGLFCIIIFFLICFEILI